MPAFFFKFTIMSWSIPAQVEKDIIAGKATYRTFQTGMGGQSILPIPANSYAVIFGYDFSPAGGGFKFQSQVLSTITGGNVPTLNAQEIRFFETQQISFYTGTDFYPFIHHCDIKTTALPAIITNAVPPDNNVIIQNQIYEEIDNTPISRQVYITSSNDVAITVGLLLATNNNQNNAIPVTNKTPSGLTYGGSGQNILTYSRFSPGTLPQGFTQPSLKEYADYNLGALGLEATDQAYAAPDPNFGLLDPTVHLSSILQDSEAQAACNYFLCLHYALYQSTTPETRG
jgi:hypothetical protein